MHRDRKSFLKRVPNQLWFKAFLTRLPNLLQREREVFYKPEFLALNPNGKLPVIIDRDPDTEPVTVFESATILLYLAEKTGKLMPAAANRWELMQWLMWQMSALGPMSGQAVHFQHHAPEQLTYPILRYRREVVRLYQILDRRLVESIYLMGNDYTILDISVYGWLHFHPLALGELYRVRIIN